MKKLWFVTFCYQKRKLLEEAVNNSKIPWQVFKEGFVYNTGENESSPAFTARQRKFPRQV